MDSIQSLVPFIVIGLLFGLALLVVKALRGKGKSLPYRSKERLMTDAELAFFVELEKVVGPQHMVFTKVRLWDVIDMERGLDKKTRGTAQNKIQSKHVDFVVCAAHDSSIRYVIELDDSSHRRSDRQERDRFLNSALEAAGIPLIRFPVKRLFSAREIYELLPKPSESLPAKR